MHNDGFMRRDSGQIEYSVAQVLTDVPKGDGIFDYLIPESLQGVIRPGMVVAVPLGSDFISAIVYRLKNDSDVDKLREVICLLDEQPILTDAQLQLAEILSKRYLTPLNRCVNTLLPEKFRRLSYVIYELSEGTGEIAVQRTLLDATQDSPETVMDRIRVFLAASAGEVPETDLATAFRGSGWRNALNRLVNTGQVRRTLRFGVPKSKVKTVSVLRTTGKEPELKALGRTSAVQARRLAILDRVVKAPDGITVAELGTMCSVKGSDIPFLEKAGFLMRAEVEVFREFESEYQDDYSANPLPLTVQQQQAFGVIHAHLRGERREEAILLQGVTGSGKTEVYLRAAAETLAAGRQVLMMVPEIALTSQIVTRFRKRFPGLVAVYHSGISSGERFDTWRRARDGQIRIIVGTRSALAVPLPELGLILVDECHDDSYYQQETQPYFSATSIVADYARLTGATVVYGSATPTVSQRYKAEQSGWALVRMTGRAAGAETPEPYLVDMRDELRADHRSLFSRKLIDEVNETLRLGKQAILFMNRRGDSSYTFCEACGFEFYCPNCEVPLTFHRANTRLQCHFCGYRTDLPPVCPACGAAELTKFSAGIEQIERLATEQFPDARILRLDSDIAEAKGEADRVLAKFAAREADILVGTRMVSKGLDFPDVRLVGIILAEIGAGLQDYRVDEQIFQLLTQVAGRSGRGAERGIAVFQTYQPDRYSIRSAMRHDYESFYTTELAYRRKMGYPPFSRMARVLVRGRDSERTERDCFALARRLRTFLKSRKSALRVIGPTPCYFSKLNGQYRWQILLRGGRLAEALTGMDFGTAKLELDPVSVL